MTKAMRHSSQKAMMKAVTIKARFCSNVDIRSATAAFTKVPSDERRAARRLLLFLSNQPTSFLSIATKTEQESLVYKKDDQST